MSDEIIAGIIGAAGAIIAALIQDSPQETKRRWLVSIGVGLACIALFFGWRGIYRLSRERTPEEIYGAEETATDSPKKPEDARADFPENSNPSDDSEKDRINYGSSSAVILSGGDGTIDAPYLISTPEQLAFFRDTVNAGNQSICAALTNDIDLKNEPWVPIGADSAYQGSFDGRGHSVRNMSPSSSVRVQSGSTVFYSTGFIGAIGHNGVVKRLNIDGDYTLAMTARELDIGTIAGVNFGTIEDCSVAVNFDLFYWNPKSNSTLGGFVAGNTGKIQNCYFVGSLCPTLTGEIGVGGLIAICLDGSIVTNCYLCGSVRPMINGDNSKSYPGLFGIAGKNIITKNLYVNSDDFDTAVGSGGANIQVEFISSNDMKSKKFAQLLGNHFEFDSNQINHGYPVLSNLSR